jgi:proline iminopeptidase
MGERYPQIEPYASGMLPVGDGHEIHWETVGNPQGTPAVWLHGGPGSGAGAGSRRTFAPRAYRAVLFDQRGCGRSRPLADSAAADLSVNTTDHLIADLEGLRDHLGIDRWVVVGASWGVTPWTASATPRDAAGGQARPVRSARATSGRPLPSARRAAPSQS